MLAVGQWFGTVCGRMRPAIALVGLGPAGAVQQTLMCHVPRGCYTQSKFRVASVRVVSGERARSDIICLEVVGQVRW